MSDSIDQIIDQLPQSGLTIRALGAGRYLEGEKYLAFNPHVGAPLPVCWLVSKKEGGVWRRLAVEGRDMLLTAAEARDLVGV